MSGKKLPPTLTFREKAKDMLKFLYRVNDERTREMFDIMVSNDKNSKQIREKIVNDIIDDFDRIDGKPTKKVLDTISFS